MRYRSKNSLAGRAPEIPQQHKESSVFVFERKNNVKAAPRLGRMNRLALSDLIRYEVTQLTTLQHPRIIHLIHPLEDTKEYMAFAAEPIYANLENLIPDEGIDKLEMKLGVLQLIDGLSYLHNSAKILHGNLCPQSIYVTTSRLWKIGGFSFSSAAKDGHTVTSAADVFSLGVLICWIYAGGKRLIDAKNNLETHAIVCGQLDAALICISEQLGANLKESMSKVLSMEVDVRPSVQLLALIKHFDDPCVSALRQLDDLGQEFDPANKAHFLSQTLQQTLPNIPEPLWFSRVLPRLCDHVYDSHELFPAVVKPLFLMLEHCESHNIHKLRTWMRRLLEHTSQKSLRAFVLENMAVLFRRLTDDKVEDRLLDLIVHSLNCDDASMQSSAIRGIPPIADFLPSQYIIRRLLPSIHTLQPYLNDNVPRQLDLLVALAALSDKCDSLSLPHLISSVVICNSTHPVIIHAKSRLVQRVVTRDPSRLRNPMDVATHLLAPLVSGIASRFTELSPAHFDDVMSSIRILLDIIEQLRYENEDQHVKHRVHGGGLGRLGNRRVSMSSNNLPRVMISAARPSISGDNRNDFRKMSFLSADGRLEDRGSRRESKDSRGSLESDVSIRIAGWGSTLDELNTGGRGRGRWRIGNGSDVSDESCQSASHQIQQHQNHPTNGQKGRRQSWLEGYMHSCSLEQGSAGSSLEARPIERSTSMKRNGTAVERRSRTRSPTADLLQDPSRPASGVPPARPSSFSNLGHNLVLTYRNFWQKE
ncbi:unnamed protein product, partial [Mesorhabditis spiculigera]